MLTIGEFSQATRLTVKALRIYHDEGLLVPEKVDARNGYRHYGDASFRRAEAITILREFGFSIAEMKDIFSRCSDDAELETFFRRRLEDVERELARMQDVRGRIRLYAENGKDESMKKDLEIREIEVDDMWLCGIRYAGRYDEIGTRFADLFKKAGRYCAGKPFAIYYDCEHKDDADIEAALPVRKEIAIAGIACRKLEGGHFVSIIHRGPYDAIGTAYKALFEYLERRGLSTDGPTRELYLKGPGMIFPRDPKNFVTEIMVPAEGHIRKPQ